MPPVLLIIDHDAVSVESSCLRVLRTQTRCERKLWGDFTPQALLHSQAPLILAHPPANTEKAAFFFNGLRENPIQIPVLAILPEFPDRELLSAVSAVTEDFVFLPLREDELNLRIARILGPYSSSREEIGNALGSETGLARLVGNHPSFLQAVKKLRLFGSSDVPVLISGETGTGKELFAHAIHALSSRRNGPFIPLDCGALPEHLAENELFGNRRGLLPMPTGTKNGWLRWRRAERCFSMKSTLSRWQISRSSCVFCRRARTVHWAPNISPGQTPASSPRQIKTSITACIAGDFAMIYTSGLMCCACTCLLCGSGTAMFRCSPDIFWKMNALPKDVSASSCRLAHCGN